MPAEFEERLFERFSRASRGASRTTTGTGLGPAIVRELAEAQRGRAWYEPNTPSGSTFRLPLPTPAHRRSAGRAPPVAAALEPDQE